MDKFLIYKNKAMKNHKKIGVVGILGYEKVNSLVTEFEKTKTIDEIIIEERAIKITAPHRFEELEQENISVKPKTIDYIMKEEESIKITMPYRTNSYDLDIKTLLRSERGVIPPDFYNKRKKK